MSDFQPYLSKACPRPAEQLLILYISGQEGEKCKGKTVLFHVIPDKAVFLKWEDGTSVHLGAFGNSLLW